jgi:hypothetical protein
VTPEIPRDWTLEQDGYGKGHDVLMTPAPIRYAATIDWVKRVYRSGMSTTGPIVSKKKYKGRGWQQALVDDAVAYLSELLR